MSGWAGGPPAEAGRWGETLAGFGSLVPLPDRDAQRGRLTVPDVVALLVTAALLGVVALGIQGPARVLLAVAFATAVPGWAVVGLVRPAVDLAGFALAVATSFTVCAFGATLMLWVSGWDPLLLFSVLAVVSGLVIGGRLAAALRAWAARYGAMARITAWSGPAYGEMAKRLVSCGREILPATRRSLVRVRPTDGLLPLAVASWAVALPGIRPEAMSDYGLIPALPYTFFAALGLLTVSLVIALGQTPLSHWRLALHLFVLTLILMGTTASAFPEPDYSWVYRHFGVVQHISWYGTVDPSLDLYQNWPGFFAGAAWFDAVAGVGSPIQYAAWAPVYFDLLAVLAMAFAFHALGVRPRVAWLALFIFVSANWVNQSYFSPQAFSFGLSITVVAALLMWFRADRPSPWVIRLSGWTRRRLRCPSEAHPPAAVHELTRWRRAGLLLAIYTIFAAIVISHQLTPYMVIFGVGVLCIAGVVRPRWLVLGFAAIAIAYLLSRLNAETRQYLQVTSLNPFHNTVGETVTNNAGLPGRVFTANMARSLSIVVWALAAVGAIRRLRRGAPIVIPLALMVSPVTLAFGQDYGGEATYRIFLFSLPWAAFLAASALIRDGHRLIAGTAARWTLWKSTRVTVVLAALMALFLPASLGLEETNYMRPTEVAASEFFYAHAKPGSVLMLATYYFPMRGAHNYDNFIVTTQGDPTLTGFPRFQKRMLTAQDLPALEYTIARYEGRARAGYIVISSGMKVDSQVFGVLPAGSLNSLDAALAASPRWRTFYRNQDAVIYELVKPPADRTPTDRASSALAWRTPTVERVSAS